MGGKPSTQKEEVKSKSKKDKKKKDKTDKNANLFNFREEIKGTIEHNFI